MDEDIVRVLRIYEFIGPRAAVELQIKRSLHGEKIFDSRSRVSIRATTLGEFPDIIYHELEKYKPDQESE